MRRSKVTVPARPPLFVERPLLRAALDEAARPAERGRVVLVCAPAGYGKTITVSDWAAADPDVPCAWVTLDAADRDEHRWWASVLVALASCPAVPAHSSLRTLAPVWADDDPSAREAFVAGVLDALDGLERGLRLVIDDVHEIVGHDALRGLADLLRHPLPSLTVVVCSRYDPPVGLDRLLLHGRLGQLRADRLVFDEAETSQLVDQQALELTASQITTLVQRTEGWIAALRLATLSLVSSGDPEEFVAAFAGDDRSVADFLVEEVLDRLSRRDRAALDAVSACSPCPVGLAAALCDDPDAPELLDGLERATAMVTAVDRHREVYRVHELLRSHVVARLRRHPDELAELYRRAAAWYESRDDHGAALRCLALSDDVQAAEVLLRSHAVELLSRGEFATLTEPRSLLSAAARADARVRLVLGLVALETDELERGAELISAAEADLSGHEGTNVAILRRVVSTRLAIARGDMARAARHARDITPHAAEGAPLRALALSTRGTALAAVHPEQACQDCAEALSTAHTHGWHYLAVQAEAGLGIAETARGRHQAMTLRARAVIDRAQAQGLDHTAWALASRCQVASAELLAGRPDLARHHVDLAAGAAINGHPQLAAMVQTIAGAADHDTGAPHTGWQQMRHARISADTSTLPDHQIAFSALLEHGAALRLGRLREAAEVARVAADRLPDAGEPLLMQVRQQWVASGDRSQRPLLAPLLEQRGRFRTELGLAEATLADAEFALALGEGPTIRRRLAHALTLAADLDVVRPLLHASEPVRRYLAEHHEGFTEFGELVDRVLAHRPPEDSDPGVALTEREHAVLELLPTLRSVAELAEDLALSVNTVKSHQRAIYQKLGADTRRDAVARAREIGLLTARQPR